MKRVRSSAAHYALPRADICLKDEESEVSRVRASGNCPRWNAKQTGVLDYILRRKSNHVLLRFCVLDPSASLFTHSASTNGPNSPHFFRLKVGAWQN
jgi:hypothetical protein